MYIPSELLQLKYDIYLRRSSDDADHQVASLDSQKGVLLKLAKENKINIARIVEESMSAKQPGRPVFNEEIQRIENGTIQGLVIWDLSRGSRNPVDSGTLSWLMQKEKLKAIVTPHRIYVSQDNVLIMNVEFGMANQYLRDLSKNVKRGLNTKNQKGQRPGVAPEGYLNDNSEGKGCSKNIVDPERFSLVRKMWDFLLTGSYSVPQILNIANEDWGYKTRKHKKLGGNPLSRTALYRIFTNTFYYGDYKYGGNWFSGEHEKMITPDEYDKAQSLLGRKGKQRPKTKAFAFTGMMRCGECGAMVTAEEKINRYGDRYIYYHCTKRVNPRCTQKAVSLGVFEKQVDEILSRIEIPESFKNWAIKYLNELHDKEAKEEIDITKSLDSSYKDCLDKIHNLIKLKISPMNTDGSLLSDEDFKKQMTPLQQEKKNLEEQRKNLGERADKWLELSQKTFNFACYARAWFSNGSLQEKREILATIGSNFLIENQLLRLDVPKPYLIVEKSKKEVDRIHARLELEEKVDISSQIEHYYSQNTTLRRERDSNPRKA